MQRKLLYIEHKSGQADCGEAWIALAQMSKSGRTVYFNGRALKRSGGQGISGNHFCMETGDEYWISGPKKNGCDRHWAGGGGVKVAEDSVAAYLAFRNLTALHPRLHPVVPPPPPVDIAKFVELEN